MLAMWYGVGSYVKTVMSFLPCPADVVTLPENAADRCGRLGLPSRKARRVSGGRRQTLQVGASE